MKLNKTFGRIATTLVATAMLLVWRLRCMLMKFQRMTTRVIDYNG